MVNLRNDIINKNFNNYIKEVEIIDLLANNINWVESYSEEITSLQQIFLKLSMKIPEFFEQIETIVNTKQIVYEISDRNPKYTSIVNEAFFLSLDSILRIITSKEEVYNLMMDDFFDLINTNKEVLQDALQLENNLILRSKEVFSLQEILKLINAFYLNKLASIENIKTIIKYFGEQTICVQSQMKKKLCDNLNEFYKFLMEKLGNIPKNKNFNFNKVLSYIFLNEYLKITFNDFRELLLQKILENDEFIANNSQIIKLILENVIINNPAYMNSNLDFLRTENSNMVKKLNEQIDNNKKLLDDKNKEKSEANKNYLELETKLDKLTRELKTKEQEFENNINIERQNFQKMEAYNNTQIKEKDETISQLESKLEKLNQELQGSNKESFMKATELNRENIKLQSEIERLKKEGGKGKSDIYNEQSANLQTLFKNIQSTFMEFKESVDKLDKENENIFKTKYLENSTKEIEDKLKNCVTELRTFCYNQVKSMNDNYEKEIKKVKDQCEELSFELTKKNAEVQEKIDQKEASENKLKETSKQITELKEISDSKDSLIKTQGDALKMYDEKVKDYIKMKENLEMSLAKSIYDFKMKEDEFDSLFMVIEGIISRKKDKYEHNLTKLSSEVKNTLQSLVKQYKFFK